MGILIFVDFANKIVGNKIEFENTPGTSVIPSVVVNKPSKPRPKREVTKVGGLTWKSKKGVYEAANVFFNRDTTEAYSYNWWLFVARINGKVVFNDYSYSPTTRKHQQIKFVVVWKNWESRSM